MSEKWVTFEAAAHQIDDRWQPSIKVRWVDSPPEDMREYRIHVFFDEKADAEEVARDEALRMANEWQRSVNDELSKMQDWLKLSHEEQVRRAKASFPVGSPFGSSSNNG
jgi:hypothetical protein